MHRYDSNSGHVIRRETVLGLVPVLHSIAQSTLMNQASGAGARDSLYRSGATGSDVYGLHTGEIAFSFRDGYDTMAPRVCDESSVTSKPSKVRGVQTSLNNTPGPLGMSFAALRRAIDSMGISSKEDRDEMLRNGIASALDIRGVVVLDQDMGDDGRYVTGLSGDITLLVSGMISVPCVLEDIRIGSSVEAVPVLPDEFENIKQRMGGQEFKSNKAQVLVRELRSRNIARALHMNTVFLMKHYDKFVAAYGVDNVAMQYLAASDGMLRFAQFAALQFLAMLVKHRVITRIGGVTLVNNGANVNVDRGLLDLGIDEKVIPGNDESWSNLFTRSLLRSTVMGREASYANFKRDVDARGRNITGRGPRLEFEEIAPWLGVLLGTIPMNVGTSNLTTHLEMLLSDIDTKKKWTTVSMEFAERVIFNGNNNSRVLHGVHQLTTDRANPDMIYDAFTHAIGGNRRVNTLSLAGGWVQLQMSQPTNLIMSILGGVNNILARRIGVAVKEGKASSRTMDPCAILVNPVGVLV